MGQELATTQNLCNRPLVFILLLYSNSELFFSNTNQCVGFYGQWLVNFCNNFKEKNIIKRGTGQVFVYSSEMSAVGGKHQLGNHHF